MLGTWLLFRLHAWARVLGPCVRGAVVVPADGANLPFVPRAVHIGVGGTMSVIINGVQVDSTYEAGWHPIAPTRIRATGTAATSITIWE